MSHDPPISDDLLSAHYDGELSSADADLAAQLLVDSADARADWGELQHISHLLRSLPAASAPAHLKAGVLQRIALLPTDTPSEHAAAAVTLAASQRPNTGVARRMAWWLGGMTVAAATIFMASRLTVWPTPQTTEMARTGAVSAERAAESRDTAAAVRQETIESLADAVVAEDTAAGRGPMSDSALAAKAQPQGSLNVGDVVTSLEYDGDSVVVVYATVVDVQQALGELQVLLSRNAIPIAQREEQRPAAFLRGLNDGRSLRNQNGTGGVEGENESLAVYVESTPAQIGAALDAFERSGQVLALASSGRVSAQSEKPAAAELDTAEAGDIGGPPTTPAPAQRGSIRGSGSTAESGTFAQRGSQAHPGAAARIAVPNPPPAPAAGAEQPAPAADAPSRVELQYGSGDAGPQSYQSVLPVPAVLQGPHSGAVKKPESPPQPVPGSPQPARRARLLVVLEPAAAP